MYIDVVIPLALPLQTLTYEIRRDEESDITIGARVAVQLDGKRMYSAIIVGLHNTSPQTFKVKPISYIIDEKPIVNSTQIELWQWIANYYMCTLGEVMCAALPLGLRMNNETIVSLTDIDTTDIDISEKEALLIDKIGANKKTTLKDLTAQPDKQQITATLQLLLDKGLITIAKNNFDTNLFAQEIKIDENADLNTSVCITDVDIASVETTPHEKKLYQTIAQKQSATLKNLTAKANEQNIVKTLQTLIQKGIVNINENLKEIYKPVYNYFVTLGANINNANELNFALDSLKKKKPQEKAMLTYLSFCEQIDFKNPHIIPKNEFLKMAHVSAATLKTLVGKHLLQIEKRETWRTQNNEENTPQNIILSPAQQNALNQINKCFETQNTVLLHGVTSSGKTEIYFNLIKNQLQQGKQVLYLVPEIALTAQLVTRLKKVFGKAVGVYHSKYSNAQRVETYLKILRQNNGENSIIIGARSALFLPFSNLGLIIVDEEHDSSYKQNDPAPRYNGRDTAIKLAQMHGAKTLLGTATPSVESYYNAAIGKYALVELTERYGGVCLPQMQTVSILRQTRRGEMNGHFTKYLLEAMFEALKKHEQIILFQNRRGFAPYLQCAECGEIPRCKNCNVSLTYHKIENRLICHYCGYSAPVPQKCPSCGSEKLQQKGLGTEKIEEELRVIFPHARIARFDLDTTRTRNAYTGIISDFEKQKIDILVGTQIVSKGLDFDNVSVVGILNADTMLNFPDFRAHERAFQLMTQVGGRAGRRNKMGRVIIQTYNPEEKTVRNVVDNNYADLYARQIAERKEFNYPPFFRLINITLKNSNLKTLNIAAAALALELRKISGMLVLGPEPPAINRVQNKYLSMIMVKINRSKLPAEIKNTIRQITSELKPTLKNTSVIFDVDA